MAGSGQLAPQFLEIVNLAVVDDPHVFGLIRHGLMPRSGYIDNGEPRVSQRCAMVLMEAAVVGPAMALRMGHSLHGSPVVRAKGSIRSENARNAAHRSLDLSSPCVQTLSRGTRARGSPIFAVGVPVTPAQMQLQPSAL